MAEVLSLLRGLRTSAASRREREDAMLASLDATLVDKIEIALEEHEARGRASAAYAAAAAAVAAAVVAPVVCLVVGRLAGS